MTSASDLRSGKTHRDENFPVASWIIHPRHRALILSFYKFVRTADDIVDHATLAADEGSVKRLIRAYWYCMEFGVVREGAALKAVGAGLLSSFGELGHFEERAQLLPFDLEVIGRTPFDPTQYQSTLFVAASEEELLSTLTSWLGSLSSGPSARDR